MKKKLIIIDGILIFCLLAILITTKAPSEVHSLSVDNTSYDTVSLSWEETDNANSYLVYRSEDGKDYEYVSSTAKNEFTDENLETGVTYSYVVRPRSGLTKADNSNVVEASTYLEKPTVKGDVSEGKVELTIDKVEGAQSYKVLRNNKEIQVIEDEVLDSEEESAEVQTVVSVKSEPDEQPESTITYVDDTADVDTSYEYKVVAVRNEAESDASKAVGLELVSPGEIETKIHGDDLVLSWGNEAYDSYKLYNGDELLTETNDTSFTLSAKEKTYDMKLVGYAEDVQSPEIERMFEVSEEPMDNKTAIQNAIDWAVDIAADDSFTYGKKPTTNRVGCYFCGTNQRNKPKGYEKTYVCMTFVTAAYAHGAQDPEVYKVCSGGKMCLSCTEDNFTRFSCWKKVGLCKNLSVSDLEPGDVIVWYDPTNGTDGHMSMYIGDGNICDASGGGWTASSISVRPGRASRYLSYRGNSHANQNYVMRYTGNGSGTMKVIKDV